MSQYLQPPQHHTQLARLSLAKFSHTTTSVNHKGPFNWNHIFGNGNLIGVFERISISSSIPTSLVLRVTQDREILEEIDIAYFVRDSIPQSQASQHASPKPAFAVVVKPPCLALKYPRGDVWIRRFQIKFSLDRDYYTSLSILSDIGCPFSESNSGPIPPLSRKPTSSQWTLCPAPSMPSTREDLISSSGMDNQLSSTNATFPLYQQSTAISPATSSVTTGSLPPSSSGTSRTALTEYAPSTSSGQLPTFETSINPKPTNQPINILNQNTHNTNNKQTVHQPTPITSCHDTQSLNQLLPPKRELPFSKPGAKRACPSLNRPSTLPQTGNNTHTIHQSNDTSKPSSHASPAIHTPQPAPTPGSKMIILKYQQAPSQPPQTAPTGKYTPIAPRLPQGNAQPMVPQSVSMSNSKPAPDEQHTTQKAGEQQTAQQPLHVLTSSDLSSYLSAPSLERTTQLENWICMNIEDDGFLQLCQDIEGVWGRVALGR